MAKKKIFILAGEPSGDKIGTNLINSLRKELEFDLVGVGGQNMQLQGLKSIYSMNDLSVMGLFDVVKRLPLLLWRNRQTAKFILKEKPDVVILIDNQVFSTMLAKKLKKASFKNPILLYVAPSVWAWKPERAKKLKPIFDEILAVLPFEPRIMKELNGPKTTYVGHPALKNIIDNSSEKNKGLIALFPGSRSGEIKRHLPLLKYLVSALKDHPKVTGFILPTLPHLAKNISKQTQSLGAYIKIITDSKERKKTQKNIIVSVVTAGTITLEQALAQTVMVGTYNPDNFMLAHYEKAGRPMIALPNIIMNERIIPEVFPPGEKAQELIKTSLELLESC
ncbi:MAG: hypothetical protein L3J19_09665, partial [Sulfurimonas sp.]|nr:hypothetical protein [Sulfurimonas sp.]